MASLMAWGLNMTRPLFPTAQVTDYRFVSVGIEKADLIITLTIRNPSFLPITVASVDYFLESNGKRPFSGHLSCLPTIAANSSHAVAIPVSLFYSKVVKLFENIEPGSVVPCKLILSVILNLPVFGRFTVRGEIGSEFVMPVLPRICLKETTFSKVSNYEVVAEFGVKVRNNGNAFGAKLRVGAGLDISFPKATVGLLKLEGAAEVEARGHGFFRVSARLRLKDIVLGLWRGARDGARGFVLKGNADADTPFRKFKLL